MKKKTIKTGPLLLCLIMLISLLSTNIVYANTDFYSQNDILFYDTNAASCSNEPALTTSTGSGVINTSALPLKAPVVKDPDRFAKAIDDWIRQKKSSSPLIGTGRHFVKGGMDAGINPILPIVQGLAETGLGTAAVSYLPKAHNAWGRTRTSSQPGTGKYYEWSSWEAAASGEDNWFQYVGRVYTEQVESNSLKDYMYRYAPPHENDTDGYIQKITQWAEEINNLAGDSIDLSEVATATGGDFTSQSDNCIDNSSGAAGGMLGDFIVYSQCDTRWKNRSFAGETACAAACGPSAMAMIITALTGKSVTPADTMSVAETIPGAIIPGGGSSSKHIPEGLSSYYGLKATLLNSKAWGPMPSIETINTELRKGSLIFTGGSGSYPFVPYGHFITIYAVTSDGKWKIGNSIGQRGIADKDKEWDPAEVYPNLNLNTYAISR